MDKQHPPSAANGNEYIPPDSSNPQPGFAFLWEAQPAGSSARRASHPLPGNGPTAGRLLGQMMTLCAARPPLATQNELRALLQRFTRPRAMLAHDAFFYTTVDLLAVIGQAIQEQMLDSFQLGEMYVGVQRLSRLAGHLPRSWTLLQSVHHVCLYGLNDLQHASERLGISHPCLLTLALDRSRRTDLEWFWFVVVQASGLQTALVAQQVEGDLWSDTQQASLYKGLWTFDPTRVQQIVDILRQAARTLLL